MKMLGKIGGCLVVAMAALGAVARELRVADVVREGGAIKSVSLSVSAGEETVFLGVMRDAVDRGEDPAAWAAVDEQVAEFPPSETATAYVYRPTGTDKAYRFLLKAVSYPYKTELDYLQATGSQYVLTDFYPHGGVSLSGGITGIKARAEITMDESDPTKTEALWGSRGAAGSQSFLLFRMANGSSGPMRYDFANGTGGYSTWLPEVGKRHVFVSELQTLRCDDKSLCESTYGTFNSSCPLALFALNQPTGVSLHSHCRIHRFQVWNDRNDDASLVLDLVPCIKDDGTPAFYNKADGRFLAPPAGVDALIPSVETLPISVTNSTLLGVTDAVVAETGNRLSNAGFEYAGDTEAQAMGWAGGARVAGGTEDCPTMTEEGRYALALRTTSAPQAATSFTVAEAGYYRLSFKLTTSLLNWVDAARLEVYLDDAQTPVGSACAFRSTAWNEAVFKKLYLSAGEHTLTLKAAFCYEPDPRIVVDDVRLAKDLSVANGFASSFAGIPDGASTEGLVSQPDTAIVESGTVVAISAKRFLFGCKNYVAKSVTVSVGGSEQTLEGNLYLFQAVAGREPTHLTWHYEEVGRGILPNPSFEEETDCSGDRVVNDKEPYHTKAWQGGIINRGNGQVYCTHSMADGTFGIALHPSYPTLTCSFEVAEEGTYQLTFFLTSRPRSASTISCGQYVDVSFDGSDPVGTALPESSEGWSMAEFSGIFLTQGTHTITFAGRLKEGVNDASSVLDLICLEKEKTGFGYRSSFAGLPSGVNARAVLSRPDVPNGICGQTVEVSAGRVTTRDGVYEVKSVDVTIGGMTWRLDGNAYAHVFSDIGMADVTWNYVALGFLPNPSFEDETNCPGDRGINGTSGYSTKAWTGGQINHSFGDVNCYNHAMADGYYGMVLGPTTIPELCCDFEIAREGLYELSFQVSARGDSSTFYSGSTINVAFDGAENPLVSVRPTSPRDWDMCVSTVRLQPGQHSIKFWAKSGETNGTVIDNVILKLLKPKYGLIIMIQ